MVVELRLDRDLLRLGEALAVQEELKSLQGVIKILIIHLYLLFYYRYLN